MLLFMLLLASTLSISFYTKTTELNTINTVHFSPDSSLVAVGTTGNTHKIYSFSTMTVAGTYSSTSGVSSVRFSPDQSYLAYALSGTTVHILNATTFANLYTLTSQFSTINQVDFNTDSNKIIVCGRQSSSKQGYEIW